VHHQVDPSHSTLTDRPQDLVLGIEGIGVFELLDFFGREVATALRAEEENLCRSRAESLALRGLQHGLVLRATNEPGARPVALYDLDLLLPRPRKVHRLDVIWRVLCAHAAALAE
jgi:hypothetical protein